MNYDPNLQTSWCANFNTTGQWIQVSLPKTEFWQGIAIAGNPLLNAYVTQIYVEVGKEDGSDKNLQ